MKYRPFYKAHTLTRHFQARSHDLSIEQAMSNLDCIQEGVYDHGLYIFLPKAEALSHQLFVEKVYPACKGKISVFGVDWMGRLFAVDSDELDKNGIATITCFDLAEPCSFSTDATFDEFHNRITVDMANELFNRKQFQEWIARNPPPDDGNTCIGYTVPLFLGGEDSVKNMSIFSRQVYYDLTTELWLAMQ